jgi:hypothetical protein
VRLRRRTRSTPLYSSVAPDRSLLVVPFEEGEGEIIPISLLHERALAEIRQIVREEVRAALRDAGAD